MSQQFIKDPDEVLDYTFSWATWLGADTIASDTVTVDTGLTKDSDSNDTTSVTVWLSGGTAGTAYKVSSKIVTAAGRTAERTIIITVRER
jgi:hypothetical protein